MNENTTSTLKKNLNRLAVLAAVLLLLKIFNYTIQEFFPVFGLVLGQLLSAFLPFLLAFMIAFLLEPLVLKIIKAGKIKRIYASVLVIMLAVLGLLLMLILIGSRLYKEMAELATTFPAIYEQTVTLLSKEMGILQNYIEINPEIRSSLLASSEEIIVSLQGFLKEGSVGLLALLGALPGFLGVIIVTAVATLLTSMSFPEVQQWFFGRINRKYVNKTRLVAQDLGAALVGFLRSQFILVSITALITIGGLLIIGNKYAFTVGILVGLLDLIPVVGPALVFIPWIVVLLFTAGLGPALKILIIYAALTVIRQILEPKILSQNIGIHPLPTLMSIYVGMKLLGVVGLILGPAILIVYEAVRKAGLFHRG